jgi:hypothetical protein
MAPPVILWHYTDAAGLRGIVTSSQLRFGDSRLLNDRTEHSYGENVLVEVLREERPSDQHDVIATGLASIDSSSHPIRRYVCSFSETEESISQWQRYGADGSGYCISFDARTLDGLLGGDVWRKKMCYTIGQQKRMLREKLKRASDAQLAMATADSGFLRFEVLIRSAQLGGGLDDALLQIKNPFFADEREWRYVFQIDTSADDSVPDPREEFALRGAYLKPFIPLPPLMSSTTVKLPITSIVCGPRLNTEVAIPATKRFLRSSGYGTVSVKPSALSEVWR